MCRIGGEGHVRDKSVQRDDGSHGPLCAQGPVARVPRVIIPWILLDGFLAEHWFCRRRRRHHLGRVLEGNRGGCIGHLYVVLAVRHVEGELGVVGL